ncbi:MAG: 50S ribosomal protein L7/L12 [bacterium]|nr:50S ribosomal protein L7/L12 [bacterium]
MTDETKKENKKEVTSSAVVKLVEEISKLSVLDLSELVAALQDKLGVSAMPVAQASAPVAGAADAPTAVEEGGNKTVIMIGAGDNKIGVIKALREINQNLTLMDAKGMTENLPAEILKDAKAEDASAAKKILETAGATVELK